MQKYNKLFAALAATVLYVIAAVSGFDLGEIGANVDGDALFSSLLAAGMVFFSPANKSDD